MAVLSSTFFHTSLIVSQNARIMPLSGLQRARTPSLPAASLRNAEEQHAHRKKSPPPSSWISFLLPRGCRKPPRKPLLEDMEVSGPTAFDTIAIAEEPAKISTKKGPRGAKRVTFTPQKARELRAKLKGTDTFHDFMYHSAIASRLASNDS